MPKGKSRGPGCGRGIVQSSSSGVFPPVYHTTAAATVTDLAAPRFSSRGSASIAAASSLSALTHEQMQQLLALLESSPSSLEPLIDKNLHNILLGYDKCTKQRSVILSDYVCHTAQAQNPLSSFIPSNGSYGPRGHAITPILISRDPYGTTTRPPSQDY
ncbi:hypothetical protein Cgig2_013296 [Carnegiea gigantea]|uniref:Uncharacterized protein n=1 Tax=Carnegiea gigantea TaxID=171969 RepID=A0A9Q1JMC6_9CARY|nr:hypothetical protein Cgig2_013296 [Carnegiea gigantea]